MVEPHFPRDSSFSKINSPFRTDRGYEQERANAIPATPSELSILEKEYGRSYLSLYGQLLHVSTMSRPQISNSMLRFGKFQSGPCRESFDGLKRIFRFLASHPNVPIMYAKNPSPSKSVITFYHPTLPSKPYTITIPLSLSSMVDSNYSTDLADRLSVSSDIVLYNGSIVSWKATKQLSVATSTTDAETRSLFSGLRRIHTFRLFLRHLGFPIPSPTIIFEDNKGTTDIVNAGRLTPRVKHIDVPLCYIHHEHIFGTFDIATCSTHLIFADGLNKALPGPTIKRHSAFYTGRRFFPKQDTEHYDLLTKSVPISL